MDAKLVESMAHLMSPYNKLMYETIRRPSESQSEISSVDSDWSDIKAIALQLGVSNPDDLITERFKVDRQKLENLIKTDSPAEGINKAEQFFDITMKNTSTYISWPCRLKIGARTKKDPHVRIVGKPDDVSKAKDQILEALDAKGSRVIMKIDISYTDHSFIIGRGGSNIKRIMENTATHIHFPDSNRSNPVEKSNQVSLCGTLEGVEKARSLVRSSTPLIISYELPIMAPGRQVPDNDTQYVKDVEAKFNIQVIFSTRPKLHSSLVLVKGSEKEAAKVQEATQLLINFMCETIANQIHVNLQLEISPHHHDIVKGKNNTHLLSIMEQTRTKIIFPDVKDMNIKPIKKSQVTISGTIDGVYKARQQLIGNLPVALIFDYPENCADSIDVTALSQKYGVFITVRQKSRQSIMCIVIKGVEKFVDKLYESRHELLKLTTPLVKPEIPATYFAPKDHNNEMLYRKTLAMLLSNYPDSPITPSLQYRSSFTTPYDHLQKFVSSNMMPMQQLQQHQQQQQQQHQNQQLHQQGHHLQQQFNDNANYMQTLNANNNNTNINNNFLSLPTAKSNNNSLQVSPRNSSTNTSGYQSFSSSTNSLEQLYPPYQPTNQSSGNHLSTTGASGISQFSPNYMAGSTRHLSSSANELHKSNYDMQSMFTFDRKKVEGYKAIERAPQGEVRTPTSHWAGLGLSKTSPFALETVASTSNSAQTWTNHSETKVPTFNLGATTSLMDATPTHQRLMVGQHKDIHSLMTHLGLDHYISTFVLNEIDIEMFASLTPENLSELGITAFGPRKKLLMAISTLNSNQIDITPKFSGSAAPGAERRLSSDW